MTIEPAYRHRQPTLTGPVYDGRWMYCNEQCATNANAPANRLAEQDAQPGDVCGCCGKPIHAVAKDL